MKFVFKSHIYCANFTELWRLNLKRKRELYSFTLTHITRLYVRFITRTFYLSDDIRVVARLSVNDVVPCAIYCIQRAAILCNNYRLFNVMGNVHGCNMNISMTLHGKPAIIVQKCSALHAINCTWNHGISVYIYYFKYRPDLLFSVPGITAKAFINKSSINYDDVSFTKHIPLWPLFVT